MPTARRNQGCLVLIGKQTHKRAVSMGNSFKPIRQRQVASFDGYRNGHPEWEDIGMDLNSLKYGKSHEWLVLEGGIATVGITDFAVRQLTDLVHVELPKKGRRLRPGEAFGEVESVKAVSDLYSPVAGEVMAVNESLADDLGLLSDDPFGKGWIIKLKVTDTSSLSELLDRKAYEAHCAEEEGHA